MNCDDFKGHTPGPWRVEHGTTMIWGACDPDDLSTYGMGMPIAEAKISSPEWAGIVGLTPNDGEANARLIAAAPDLLAEVTRLREVTVQEAARVLLDDRRLSMVACDVMFRMNNCASPSDYAAAYDNALRALAEGTALDGQEHPTNEA